MKPRVINPLFMYLDPGSGTFMLQLIIGGLIIIGGPILLVGAGVVYWIVQTKKRRNKCPQCGVDNTKDARFCTACGHQFSPGN